MVYVDTNWLGACLFCSQPAIGWLALPAGSTCTRESSENRSVRPAPACAQGRKQCLVERSPFSVSLCLRCSVVLFREYLSFVFHRLSNRLVGRQDGKSVPLCWSYLIQVWTSFVCEVAMALWQNIWQSGAFICRFRVCG